MGPPKLNTVSDTQDRDDEGSDAVPSPAAVALPTARAADANGLPSNSGI